MKKWRPLHLRDIIDPVLSQRLNTSTLEAGELRGAMEHLADALNDRFSQLFPGEDEPEYPEATVAQFFKPEPAPEDPPDYSCPICGEDSRGAECVHGSFECITAANRRIKKLERDRDAAYAKGAEDFRESVAKLFMEEKPISDYNYASASVIRSHPIPKPKETQE